MGICFSIKYKIIYFEIHESIQLIIHNQIILLIFFFIIKKKIKDFY